MVEYCGFGHTEHVPEGFEVCLVSVFQSSDSFLDLDYFLDCVFVSLEQGGAFFDVGVIEPIKRLPFFLGNNIMNFRKRSIDSTGPLYKLTRFPLKTKFNFLKYPIIIRNQVSHLMFQFFLY